MSEIQISAKQLRAMLRAQDYENALPVLDALIRENPNNAPAHWHRATCLKAFGRLDEALAEVKHVLRINPSYAPAWIKQAELAIALDENYSDFEADLRKALAVDPRAAESLRALARALHGTARMQKAQQILSHVLDTLDAKERNSKIALRQGKNLDQALAQFASDDPLDRQATHIAAQIYRVGNETEPNFVQSRIEDYPKYQQTFARQALQKMTQAGFELVGDYEPLHLREVLDKPTLVRIYRGDQGTSFATSYRLAPKWPGRAGFLISFFSGKWKKPAIIELETAISDGQFILTNNSGNANPFAYGANIAIEKLALGTPIEAVIKRHRARVTEYLGIHHKERALSATSMEEITQRLTQLTQAKNRYRQSICYITDSELREMLGGHYDPLAHRVRTRLSALTQQQ